ncbi:MAG: type I-E CRISPR-associated protein Cse1/CasA [Janthinobacterium lividum]
MSSFNLLSEPWIPVMAEGAVREVGIREALLHSHEFGDIQLSSPLETAAVTRLLLCAAHAVCGPVTWRDSKTLLQAGRFSVVTLAAYFDEWHDQFDLFGEQPFLQVGSLTMGQATPLAALSTEAATGNNATLFDHNRDDDPPAFTPAEAARKLVTAQAFALGFGRAADAVVAGRPFPRPYLADAICLRGVTVWLSSKNLFETLVLNMVPRTSEKIPPPEPPEKRPIWEQTDPLQRLDQVVGGKRVAVRAQSIMDRYVWQSRMARLLPETDADGRIVVRRSYFTQGREADKSEGDPMKVFVASKEEGIYALGLNAGKASWRDLYSLLAFSDKTPQNPIFSHIARLVSQNVISHTAQYGLNVVGLATDPGKAGKFLLWRHDRLSVPAALLEDQLLVGLLGTALSDAEFVAGELQKRIYLVARDFVPPHGNPDPKDVGNLADVLDARPAYWARIESHFVRLLSALPQETYTVLDVWRSRLAEEAERSLRESCRQLGNTPQAMRAKAAVSFRIQADENAVMEQRRERKKQADFQKRQKGREHVAQ